MLRLGGAAALAAAAGCAAPRADLASRRRELGAPAPGEPAYRTWLPASAPDEDETDDGSGVGTAAVRYVDVERAFDRGGTLPVGQAGSLFDFWSVGDWFGHDLTDLDALLVFATSPLTLAYVGDISTTDAEAALEASGYDAVPTEGPWAFFLRADQPRAVGVTESAVVQAELGGRSDAAVRDGADRVRAILGANAGDRTRRGEADDRFERLTERLGRGIRTTVPLEPPSWLPDGGQWGTTLDATADEYVRRASVALPEGAASIEDALADHLRDAWGGEPTVYAADDGAEGVLAATADEPIGDVADAVPPRATLGFEYDADERRGVVRHLAGDALDRSRFFITVDGGTNEALRLGDGRFEPGNRFAIGGLPADVRLTFRYRLESGLTAALGSFVGSGTATTEPDGLGTE